MSSQHATRVMHTGDYFISKASVFEWKEKDRWDQPDVLARVLGDGKYSPFVEIHRVRWAEEATPRELRSESAIQKAETIGKLVIKSTGIVVDALVLAWPKERR